MEQYTIRLPVSRGIAGNTTIYAKATPLEMISYMGCGKKIIKLKDMDKKIAAAIRETLVIKNPESIYRAVEKIMAIVGGVRKPIHEYYQQWCKETKRNGGILIGSSIREFFDWHEIQSPQSKNE